MSYYGVVARVKAGGIAEEIGLKRGDKIVEINGQPLLDIIDLSFALADSEIEMLVEYRDGTREIIEFDKDCDEELGAEFESAVFDGVRRCANRCLFCFVDQMAPHLRASLYVKDDDYRMSFLYGNFITLTNDGAAEFSRIRRLHLSPLYISVHATDGELRSRLLNNRRGARIMEQIAQLTEAGIELHTQVVLCPGLNDGEALARTIEDLERFRPAILSLAIVPVGLSRFRDRCAALDGFTPARAGAVIAQVQPYQERSRAATGRSFVYLADEFYLLAGAPIPEAAAYDGFPQLENGVGLVRNFIMEWEAAQSSVGDGYAAPLYLDVICGVSAQKILRPLVDALRVPNLNVRLVAVKNRFFGEQITVSGLLTGQDVEYELKALPGRRDGVVIPGVALRQGETVFLDDCDYTALARKFGVPIRPAGGGGELRALLEHWRRD